MTTPLTGGFPCLKIGDVIETDLKSYDPPRKLVYRLLTQNAVEFARTLLVEGRWRKVETQ